MASGLPLPIPGLEDIIDSDNSTSFIDASLQVMDDVTTNSDSSTLTIDQHLHSLSRDTAEIRSAYETIRSLLTDSSRGLDKQLRYLNMIQRTCAETGVTAWVKNDPDVIKSFDYNKGRRVIIWVTNHRIPVLFMPPALFLFPHAHHLSSMQSLSPSMDQIMFRPVVRFTFMAKKLNESYLTIIIIIPGVK